MPNATRTVEPIRKELKTLPGGYVILQQLSYWDMLKRQDNTTRMSMEAAQKNENRKVDIEFTSQWTTEFDFRNCIVDHNLEDAEGKKLDLTNTMTLSVLDPRVGQEIADLIAALNEAETDLTDFTDAQNSSSADSTTMPNEPTVQT